MQQIAIGIASTNVNIRNAPTSIPKIPQTPSGPGVGGTRLWVITRPAASETPRPIKDFLVAFESDLAIGLSTTKPESQKTGIDTRKPVNANAISSRPLPKILMKV